MVSSKYVHISPRGFVKSIHNAKGSDSVGGTIPQLLNKIIKEPIKGGALEEQPRKSNMFVGTISSKLGLVEDKKPVERITRGGELINSLQNLQFSKKGKSRKDQNIKFIID